MLSQGLRENVVDGGQVLADEYLGLRCRANTSGWSIQVLLGTFSVLCLVGWEAFIGLGYHNFICVQEWVLYSLLRDHQ